MWRGGMYIFAIVAAQPTALKLWQNIPHVTI